MKTYFILAILAFISIGCSRVKTVEVKGETYMDGDLVDTITETKVVLSAFTEKSEVGADRMIHCSITKDGGGLSRKKGEKQTEWVTTATGDYCLTYPLSVTNEGIKGLKFVDTVTKSGNGYKIFKWIF